MASVGQPALSQANMPTGCPVGAEHQYKVLGSNLQSIAGKLMENQALTLEDGMALYTHPDLHELGALANCVRGKIRL